MSSIRLGLVGCGLRGIGLWRLCHRLADAEPVALVDSNVTLKAKLTAEFPQCRFFSDYEQMLDAQIIDAVIVETPPSTHASLSMAALKKGIHVLTDVPLLHSLDEVKPLWDTSAASDAIFMFGSNANYWSFVDVFSGMKAQGLLGKLFYMEAEYIHDITEFAETTPWRHNYEPIRYCTHSLGPTLQWLEEELVSVSCFDSGGHVFPNQGGHDAMIAIFKSRGGAIVKLTTSFTNSLSFGVHRYVCHGTEGYFECRWPLTGGNPQTIFSTKKIPGMDKPVSIELTADPPGSGSPEDGEVFSRIDQAMLSDFIKSIKTGKCRLDMKTGLRMTLPGLYALESSKQGGTVTAIQYPWEK